MRFILVEDLLTEEQILPVINAITHLGGERRLRTSNKSGEKTLRKKIQLALNNQDEIKIDDLSKYAIHHKKQHGAADSDDLANIVLLPNNIHNGISANAAKNLFNNKLRDDFIKVGISFNKIADYINYYTLQQAVNKQAPEIDLVIYDKEEVQKLLKSIPDLYVKEVENYTNQLVNSDVAIPLTKLFK